MSSSSTYKFIPPPDGASSLQPSAARALFRTNGYYGPTTGFCDGYVQANLLVVPEDLADGLEKFFKLNSAPFPLLYKSRAGESFAPPLAESSDVKTDLPRYLVFSKGRNVDEVLDLGGFEQSWSNMVSFYLGCSFSFEQALQSKGIRVKTMEAGLCVPMYLTNIQLKPMGVFAGLMVTSMRPIKIAQLTEAFSITARYPSSHGAPVHIGNPARIGISDLSGVLAGDLPELAEDEVPVFWACGFSNTQILKDAAPPLAFTHKAGSMFISDRKAEPECDTVQVEIVQLSRPNQPYFASPVDAKSAEILHSLEQSLLDDPGERGVAHLYQKSDLLKAVLSLSHASRVAVTTGFPVHSDLDVKEETDGLPGALSICQALLALEKEVTLIADSANIELFESCVEKANLRAKLDVIACSRAVELWKAADASTPPWDGFVAIERAGRSKDGSYRSMKGNQVFVDPVDDLFVMALSNPLVSTIGIGDGGNELGMGKVYEQVVQNIRHGDKIACTTAADFLIAAGVSNWAGYAVSLGLYVVSSSTTHWRYRNNGLLPLNHTPCFKLDDFLPSMDEISSLLKHMNELGILDGMTRKKDQYVDGQPLKTHLNKVQEMKDIVAKYDSSSTGLPQQKKRCIHD